MLYIPFPFKRCSKCKSDFLPAFSNFTKNRHCKDGLDSWCRGCHRQKTQEWRHRDPELTRERGRAYYRLAVAKRRVTERRYRQKYPDKVHSATKRWRLANPDKSRAKNQRYENRKRNLPHNFTQDEWHLAVKHFNGCCAYCGNPPSLFDQFPVLIQEHFVPTSKGGGYVAANILPACKRCNDSKHDSDPIEWLTRRFGKRKANQILKSIRAYFDWIKDRH